VAAVERGVGTARPPLVLHELEQPDRERACGEHGGNGRNRVADGFLSGGERLPQVVELGEDAATLLRRGVDRSRPRPPGDSSRASDRREQRENPVRRMPRSKEKSCRRQVEEERVAGRERKVDERRELEPRLTEPESEPRERSGLESPDDGERRAGDQVRPGHPRERQRRGREQRREVALRPAPEIDRGQGAVDGGRREQPEALLAHPPDGRVEDPRARQADERSAAEHER